MKKWIYLLMIFGLFILGGCNLFSGLDEEDLDGSSFDYKLEESMASGDYATVVSLITNKIASTPELKIIDDKLKEYEPDWETATTTQLEDYYDEFSDRKWVTDIAIRKNRNWPVWTVELMFDKSNQKFIEIASTQHTSIMSGKTSFDNRNTLLGTVPGVIGLKTGFHNDAKYNMAVAFNKEGKLYLAVLFGGNSMKIRDSEMKRTVLDFSPKMDEEKIIYVEEPVNTYVKPKVTTNIINTTNFYIPDSTSIIDTNLSRKEYENSGFNSPIIVK